MPKVEPRIMRGAMELLPRDQIAFQRMLDTIRSTYQRFGFLPVETPAMEYVDVLLTKSGGETEKQVYFVQSTGLRDQGREPELALRFDLTVPLARYVAAHEGELAFPFRRYQIQRVYRGESAQRGRYREFYQCDIDVIGKDSLSLEYDAEIPVVIYHVFRALEVGKFTIHLNHRGLLRGFLESVGARAPEQQMRALREIDKLDKRGPAAVREALESAAVGLESSQARRLMELVALEGTSREVLAHLRALPVTGDCWDAALADLEAVVEGIAASRVPEEYIRVNPAIARGLDYYTGIVYETLLDDHPGIGSVCSGGRYDDLAGLYTRSRLPGVGISIGATRLFYQLRELGIGRDAGSTVQVLVTRMDQALAADYLEIAAELRAAGLNTEVRLEAGKIGKQLKYADRSGIRFAVLLGSEEKARGTVVVKDLRSGDQKELPRAELAATLSEACR